MADRRVDHLLIGGGIAAATCAQALREQGATGSVLLVGRELDPPYHRPPLTKGYLAGAETKDEGSIEVPSDVELLTRPSVLDLAPARVRRSCRRRRPSSTAAPCWPPARWSAACSST